MILKEAVSEFIALSAVASLFSGGGGVEIFTFKKNKS